MLLYPFRFIQIHKEITNKIDVKRSHIYPIGMLFKFITCEKPKFLAIQAFRSLLLLAKISIVYILVIFQRSRGTYSLLF